MNTFDDLIIQYERQGFHDRAKWLENIEQKIPASFKERIKKNDKSIFRELILPTWLTWDMLRAWALEGEENEICAICNNIAPSFVVYKSLIICNGCLEELKTLNP